MGLLSNRVGLLSNEAGDNMYETRMMQKLLVDSGWEDGKDFMYHLEECASQVDMGVTHSESVWKERVHLGLQFAFSRSS